MSESPPDRDAEPRMANPPAASRAQPRRHWQSSVLAWPGGPDSAQRWKRTEGSFVSDDLGVPGPASSVFLNQLLLAVGVLLLVSIDFVATGRTSAPLFFTGAVLVFALTGVAVVVKWSDLPRWTSALIPVLDIVAILLMRQGRDDLAPSVLMVFPVIWLASHFGLVGAVLGPTLAGAALWFGAIQEAEPLDSGDFPRLLVVPVVLVFVATSSYLTTKRTQAQRVLLNRQAAMLERALAHARREERTLDEVLNAVDFAVVGFDAENRPVIMNRTQREWSKRTTGNELSLDPPVVYAHDRVTLLDEAARPHRRVLAGETFDDVVVWIGAPGEQRRALAVTGRQLFDEDGRREGAVMVSRDITELMESIQARDDLVSSVSHELRTPLTSLLGYLELVQDDPTLAQTTRAHVDTAAKNADRLISIVSDLLAAKSDGDPLVVNIAPCDIADVVQQSVRSFGPLAQQRSMTFTVAADDETIVPADDFRVRQIIDNLLSNAVKYGNDGGVIGVRVSGTERHVEVRVSDSGNGIPAQEHARIFDRFYRAESVRRTSVHGTGLGLSIGRDMAREHGGELSVESSGPHGTTMLLRLPRAGRER